MANSREASYSQCPKQTQLYFLGEIHIKGLLLSSCFNMQFRWLPTNSQSGKCMSLIVVIDRQWWRNKSILQEPNSGPADPLRYWLASIHGLKLKLITENNWPHVLMGYAAYPRRRSVSTDKCPGIHSVMLISTAQDLFKWEVKHEQNKTESVKC